MILYDLNRIKSYMLSLLTLSGIACVKYFPNHDLLKRINTVRPNYLAYINVISKISSRIEDLKFEEEFRTDELIKYAVSKNPYVMRWIPKHRITKEICDLVVSHNRYTNRIISYLFPDEFKTEQLWMKIIINNWKEIHFIPEYLKNKEFYRRLLSENAFIYKSIPNQFQTNEMLEFAFSKSERYETFYRKNESNK